MIKHPFEYQQPTAAMVEDITKVREACKNLYRVLDQISIKLPPDDPSKFSEARQANNANARASLLAARQRLEEVSMWANKAVVFADCEAYRDQPV